MNATSMQSHQGESVIQIHNLTKVFGDFKATEIFDKMDRVLENLDFLDKKDWLTEKLPLGWKQKLAFCVANFHSPKVIFLDEPTGGVDPITRRKFWELIHEVASKGTSIFVTTHYMDEAEYCHRISIMVDGKIKALDTPENLKKQYSVQDMESVFFTLASQATRDE